MKLLKLLTITVNMMHLSIWIEDSCVLYGSGHLHQINLAQPGQVGQHQFIADIERSSASKPQMDERDRKQGKV